MLKNWHKDLCFEDCYKLEFTGIPGKILRWTIKGIVIFLEVVNATWMSKLQPYLVLYIIVTRLIIGIDNN